MRLLQLREGEGRGGGFSGADHCGVAGVWLVGEWLGYAGVHLKVRNNVDVTMVG